MRKVCILLIFSLTAKFASSQSQNIYGLSFTKMDGTTQSLSAYQGKKILFIILPVTKTDDDSTYLDTLNAMDTRHSDSLVMIGVLSYEDGYFDDSLYNLQPWFQSMLDSNFVITSGMSTRKASVYQDPVFAWLTNASQNGHFDYDVQGTDEKFFLNASGELYGVFDPSQKLDEPTLEAMLDK